MDQVDGVEFGTAPKRGADPDSGVVEFGRRNTAAKPAELNLRSSPPTWLPARKPEPMTASHT